MHTFPVPADPRLFIWRHVKLYTETTLSGWQSTTELLAHQAYKVLYTLWLRRFHMVNAWRWVRAFPQGHIMCEASFELIRMVMHAWSPQTECRWVEPHPGKAVLIAASLWRKGVWGIARQDMDVLALEYQNILWTKIPSPAEPKLFKQLAQADLETVTRCLQP